MPTRAAGGTLERAAVGALAWTVAGRIGQQAVVLVATAVLARLVAPEEFGLVAMAAVFTGFAAIFVDAGLSSALVHEPRLTEAHRRSAFTITVSAGLALGLLLAAAAPLIARFYGEPRLAGVVAVLALAFPLAGLASVPAALGQRTMSFRRLSMIELAGVLLGYAAAIVAAAAGLGVWSLVVLTLTQAVVRAVALWLTDDWRPRVGLDRAALGTLTRFGNPLVGASTVNYWMRNADNLLVGRFAGAVQLGYYTRAYALMLLPLTQVTWLAGRVMLPALTRIRDDVARMREAYLRATSLIGFVTLPAMTLLFVLAEPLVLVLLGPDWTSVVTLFRILCGVGVLQSVTSSSGWVLQALGRTDWMFRWSLVNGTITVTAFAIGVHWGATGVAAAYAIRTALVAPVALALPGRLLRYRPADVVRGVAGSAVLCVPVGLVAAAIAAAVPGAAPQLLVGALVGVTLYIALAAAVRLRAYTDARGLFLRYVVRRQPLPAT
jgi:PST family polysaccharide transporter